MDNYKNNLLYLGNRIKQRRELLNMSQEELANKAGYTSVNARSSINKIEKGKSDIPSSKIEIIAKALGVTPAYIMGWDKENKLGEQESLKNYLQSLGYNITSVYAKEENSKWIEVEHKQFDDNGNLQLPPSLRQKHKISKGEKSVILTNEEFKELQDNIENIANYEIDKLFKSKE